MMQRAQPPALAVLLIAFSLSSTSSNKGGVTAFLSKKNVDAPISRIFECSDATVSTLFSSGHQRSSALPPLYYTNGNDVVRGDQRLVTAINSPQEFAAFLDTSSTLYKSSDTRSRSINSDAAAAALNPNTDLRVVKVYASWCLSCKSFDVRYRKLANRHRAPNSDLYAGFPRVQFAELEFGANEALCRSLGATKLPYVLLYRPGDGYTEPREEFVCGPSQFDLVIKAVERHTTGAATTSGRVSRNVEE